ncbi:MAG TPA: hypothetical protein P5121_00450 [Caldilineaceae bacterium]|nr:hypothetical protein [Caldilineaceae bacterium]
MKPVVNGLEQVYGDQIAFRRYNIASPEGEAWASQYSLRGHPAFLLLNTQGEESWRYVGVVAQAVVEAELNALLP